MTRNVVALLVAGTVAAGIPALAHHSFAMFDQRKVMTLEGTVHEFQWTNPHAFIELDVPNGTRAQRWSIELNSPNNLTRQGWRRTSLKAGEAISVRVAPLRNTGAALAPHSAFLILQGLETLGLRMERHCENALKVARHLKAHPKVTWVNYAALPDSPYHALAQKITGGHASGILSFGIVGGKEAGAIPRRAKKANIPSHQA